MPTIDIPNKICSHCGGTKWYFRSSNPNFFECFDKRKEKAKIMYEKNKNNPEFVEKRKNWMYNWRQSNKEHVKKYKNSYDKTEKGKEGKKRRYQYAISEMRDGYLRSLLRANQPVQLLKDDFSEEDYILQKKLLTLKRKLNITRRNKESKIVNIPNKICPHCGETKWRAESYSSVNNPNAFRYRCVKQTNEWSKLSRERKKLLYA
jgi:ribosomal protein S27AE